jgi:hypothetical protein
MRLRLRAVLRFGLAAGALLSSLTFAPVVSAHSHVTIGDYHITIGWMNEPTLVGQPNGVEVLIEDQDENPVVDLGGDSLAVVISTGEQETPSLPLTPAFSIEGGFGTPGHYTAELIPTLPGDYTFHLTGSIHDEPVDVSITSGDDTFSPVNSTSDLEFPIKVPTLADVSTRLERIDGRIAELAEDNPGEEALVAAAAATETAKAATASADRAMLLGIVVGGAGVLIGAIALVLAMRAGRRGAGSA